MTIRSTKTTLSKLKKDGYQGLYLDKGGHLYYLYWEDLGVSSVDRSPIPHMHLQDKIVLHPDVKLRDVFPILASDKVIAKLFSRYHIKDLLKLYKNHNPKKRIKIDPNNGPTRLELHWAIECFDGYDSHEKRVKKAIDAGDEKWLKRYVPEISLKDGKLKLPARYKPKKRWDIFGEEESEFLTVDTKKLETQCIIDSIHKFVKDPTFSSPWAAGTQRPDFRGVSVATEDSKDGMYKVGEDISWGLMGDFDELLSLPLTLGKLEVYSSLLQIDSKTKSKKDLQHRVVENPEYSLFSLLDGILWELSFYGSPSMTKKFKENLQERVEIVIEKQKTK